MQRSDYSFENSIVHSVCLGAWIMVRIFAFSQLADGCDQVSFVDLGAEQ